MWDKNEKISKVENLFKISQLLSIKYVTIDLCKLIYETIFMTQTNFYFLPFVPFIKIELKVKRLCT